MKSFNAELLLLVITIIWGATFTFTKLGLGFVSPFTYNLFRFIIAITLSLILWRKSIFSITRKTFIEGLILGLFYAGGFAFQTLGLFYTTVTKSAFITGLSVVFTPIVFLITQKKNIPINQKVGIIVALFGLWLFTKPVWNNINIGDLLTLISTFFWAFYLVYMNVFTEKVKSFAITSQLVFLQFIVVGFVSLCGSLAFEFDKLILPTNEILIFSLLYNGIIASVLLTTIHTSVQKYTTPIKAALIFSLEPVFAAIFALIILNEILSLREYIGALVLFTGIIVSELPTDLKRIIFKETKR